MHKIMILYTQSQANDALHAKEVFENELSCHRIAYEPIRYGYQIGDYQFFFVNLQAEREAKFFDTKGPWHTIYAVNSIVKIEKESLEMQADKVISIKQPSSIIVDLVLEVIHLKEEPLLA